MHDPAARLFVETLFRDTLTALEPSRAVHAALDAITGAGEGNPSARTMAARVHLLGLGKAAIGITRAAQHWCLRNGLQVAGGIVITHEPATSIAPSIECLTGDHPLPGARSQAAADALGGYVRTAVGTGDTAIVLLSGGTSALIGAPRDGLDAATYRELGTALLTAGLRIDDLNLLRRRLSRWAAGRLGAALQARGSAVQVLVMSDVIGDDLASIGSGPCMPGEPDDAVLDAVMARATLDARRRALLRHALRSTAPATPASALAPIPHRMIGSSIVARQLVHTLADHRGVRTTGVPQALDGDAHTAGAQVARDLLQLALTRRTMQDVGARIVCGWGGEPTVALPAGDVPPGGRMQALALAAARALADAGDAAIGITLLAAGTDGRDGTTDAAGAIVDAFTWAAVGAAGRDPAADLATHHSHEALRAAGALIPAFASGINVNDLVIGSVHA